MTYSVGIGCGLVKRVSVRRRRRVGDRSRNSEENVSSRTGAVNDTGCRIDAHRPEAPDCHICVNRTAKTGTRILRVVDKHLSSVALVKGIGPVKQVNDALVQEFFPLL